MNIPGYQPFYEMKPPATPATLRQESGVCRNVAGVAGYPDPYLVVERASIREYCGEQTRPDANRAAAAECDARRPVDTAPDAGRQYMTYLREWTPTDPGDLPQPPPRTQDNAPLWRLFWAAVEGR